MSARVVVVNNSELAKAAYSAALAKHVRLKNWEYSSPSDKICPLGSYRLTVGKYKPKTFHTRAGYVKTAVFEKRTYAPLYTSVVTLNDSNPHEITYMSGFAGSIKTRTLRLPANF